MEDDIKLGNKQGWWFWEHWKHAGVQRILAKIPGDGEHREHGARTTAKSWGKWQPTQNEVEMKNLAEIRRN